MKLKLLAILPVVLSCASALGADAERTIQADVKEVKGPRSMVWQDCVGAGRVGEGLRDGWRRQLEECKKNIGFNYIRMHGLLTDELGVYNEDKDGNPRYNWQYIDDVYDFLLDTGVRPFVEVGFMPNALASGTQTIFTWKGNVTPPKDYAKWDALITALVQHWTDRYGADEVKKWRFEIWNEPQLRDFWAPQGKTPLNAYLELYDHTSKAIAAVNKDYQIGGPAGPGWFNELRQYADQNDLKLDFLSTHPYGLAGGPTGLDQYGNRFLYLSTDMQAVANGANRMLGGGGAGGGGRGRGVGGMGPAGGAVESNLPIDITEWSASYSSRDPVHDSYFSAPYILEQLRNTERMRSMSYWTFTDVFEESGIPPRPFHGGFGLINYQDIKKPTYWAYWCLARLGSTEINSSDPQSYVCTDGKGGYQVLFWDLVYPITDRLSNHEFFWKPHPAKEKGNVAVKLANVPAGSYTVTTYQIGYKHNDPLSHWLELGSPANLSRQQTAEFKSLSSNKPVAESNETVNGEFSTTLPMLENSVYMLTLTPDTQ